MRKIIILVILLITNFVIGQNQFSRTYDKYINEDKNGVVSEWYFIDVVVVFNAEGGKDVIMHFPKSTIKFRRIGKVEEGVNDDYLKYQIFEVVELSSGNTLNMQLFDNAFRLIFKDGETIEYH